MTYASNQPSDSTLPTITTPSSAAARFARFPFLAPFDAPVSVWLSFVMSSVVHCSALAVGLGVGARISGTGPEKSFPVIRDNVCISTARLALEIRCILGRTNWSPVI